MEPVHLGFRPFEISADEDVEWMDQALIAARMAEALGDVPVGAVAVADGRLIAQDRNRREELGDPTAHAEILVLREAARRLGSWRLSNVTLYVTLEPCPMCAGALVNSRVRRLVYGAIDPKGGGVESLYGIGQDGRQNHRLSVTRAVRAEACADILKQFFSKRR